MSKRRLRMLLELAALDDGVYRIYYGSDLRTADAAMRAGLVARWQFLSGMGYRITDAGRLALGKEFSIKAK